MHKSVSVLITHHLQKNEPYLTRAIDSVINQTLKHTYLHVICSNPVSQEIKDKYGSANFIENESLNSSTKKCDFWLDNLVGKDDNTLYMSNDVILGKHCLMAMSSNENCIQSPLSNNEYMSRYYWPIPWNRSAYDIGEVNEQEVMAYSPNQSILIRAPWISFYAPFMHKKIWDNVGRLDPELDKKNNDMDFCFRARKMGYLTFINPACFALHYGSKTTVDYVSNDDANAADSYMFNKWGPSGIVENLV